MKSGLEGRNNAEATWPVAYDDPVSMKSGLEGRNNWSSCVRKTSTSVSAVSMKSGLEGRNNV